MEDKYTTNKYQFFTSTTDSWDAMLHACGSAEKSIYLEEYVLDPDQIGSKFINLFIEKAEKGIDVQLILDWWGCKKLQGSALLTSLKRAGVKVMFYNMPKQKWWYNLKQNFFPRDHRKLLIVDKKITFIGGVCIYDKINGWRDTMVRIRGKVTKQFLYLFRQMSNKLVEHQPTVEHPDFETVENFSVVANVPDQRVRKFTKALLKEIAMAKTSIRITTPYFVPTGELIYALKQALNRGVEVELILSKYSHYPTYILGKKFCGSLLNHGAKVYYYEPNMLHLKMIIIDGKWSAIGSCNLDELSINRNAEIMLTSTDSEFCAKLEWHFNCDRAESEVFDLDTWKKRPALEKLGANLFVIFKHYL